MRPETVVPVKSDVKRTGRTRAEGERAIPKGDQYFLATRRYASRKGIPSSRTRR